MCVPALRLRFEVYLALVLFIYMVFLNLELLISYYTVFVFQTSQEYFSIQDISYDAYYTDNAPTCIDAKADTNDDDDAKL